MQVVIHEYKNQSRVFNQIESLYSYVSDSEFMFSDILWLDESFTDLCNILKSKLHIFREPKIKHFDYPTIKVQNVPKDITICLSGGKDSAAAAFHYKKLGYNVHLYHAHGINKAYGDEKTAAAKIAKYLGCDLHIDDFNILGRNYFIEHPLKNYIIANGAIHYALAMGYAPVIALGNFAQSSIDFNEFEVCGGDCIEMWDAYKKIIQRVIPNFDIQIPLQTNSDTFELLSEDFDLLKLAVSCMSPYRFRAHWKHRAEEKYNVRIFENRCGVCWKCCLEWMWLADHDKIEYNERFYIHCYEILERTIFKETGSPADSVQDVWDNYMFYPIEQSKAYDLLKDRKILQGFH